MLCYVVGDPQETRCQGIFSLVLQTPPKKKTQHTHNPLFHTHTHTHTHTYTHTHTHTHTHNLVQVSKGGILLPESSKPTLNQGTVLAVGPGGRGQVCVDVCVCVCVGVCGCGCVCGCCVCVCVWVLCVWVVCVWKLFEHIHTHTLNFRLCMGVCVALCSVCFTGQ